MSQQCNDEAEQVHNTNANRHNHNTEHDFGSNPDEVLVPAKTKEIIGPHWASYRKGSKRNVGAANPKHWSASILSKEP
jgi:hypothetical protein